MPKSEHSDVVVRLAYSAGRDDPARGIFRRMPIDPLFTDELTIAIRSDEAPEARWSGTVGDRPQVHLAGTARALDELGRYLIALARLETEDREPYTSLDDVQLADGGTVRFLPRRIAR